MVQYLLDEVHHLHLRPLLGHVGLHLRVGVIDDGQEHVLTRKRKEKINPGHFTPEANCNNSTLLLLLTMRMKKIKKIKVVK